MILVIDNYDSFTYNLVQYLGELGADIHVVRNDAIDVDGIEARQPDGIVISPGPCTPNEAGVSVDLVKQLAGRVPILGVCLGHQCLGQAFGARVIRAHDVMHGKISAIHHNATGVFSGLPTPLTATRYHSLIVAHEALPEAFDVTAWTETEDGALDEIMGLVHRPTGAEGVQFHPESILSEHGHAMLRTFLDRTK